MCRVQLGLMGNNAQHGGRDGKCMDDALLKTRLTSVNKMDVRDCHCCVTDIGW